MKELLLATNYRKLAISKILKEEAEDCLFSLKEDYFFDMKSKKIFTWIKKHYSKHKKIPTLEALKATISTQLNDKGDVYVAYLDAIELVDSTKVNTPEIVDGLTNEYSTHYVDSAIKTLVSAAEERDITEVKRLVEDIGMALTLDVDVLPIPIEDLEIHPETVKILEPFLPTMHAKGLGFSGVTLVSAASGGGKSIFALNQAVFSYMQGYDVLYLNIEINSQEQLLRTVSHIGKIEFETIYNTTLSKEDINHLNTIKNDFFNRPNKFKMVNAPLDSDTLVNLIQAEVATGLDLVVLDYIQLVENAGYEKSWEFLQKLIKRLHRLALQHKVVILTPIQINASEVDIDSNTVDITTRGSRELEFTSTVWLHIHQEPDEREEQAARIFTIKSRNSAKYTYVVKTYFNKMTFEDTGITL